MVLVKLTIGDWSEDGHSQYDEFVYTSNKSLKEIQDAYKQSCKKTGVQFNHNTNYTGLEMDWQHPEYDDRHICTEYLSSTISKLAYDILSSFFELDKDFMECIDVEQFVVLITNFIKISLPDWEIKEAAFKKSELRNVPAINGWWGDLNHGFGYGLYD